MSAEPEIKPKKPAKLRVWRAALIVLPTRSMIDMDYKAISVTVPPHPPRPEKPRFNKEF